MINEEIDRILTELKLTPEEFAKKIGVVKSSIYKLLNGDTKKLTKVMASKISKVYPEYTYNYLKSLNKKKSNAIIKSNEIFLNKGKEQISIDEIYKFIIENEEEILANKSFKIWVSEKIYKGMAGLSTDLRSE